MATAGRGSKASEDPQALAAELNKLAIDASLHSRPDLERIVDLCTKILRSAPKDEDVLRTKVVALVRLERYTDALALINTADTRNDNLRLGFEKAYCLYRTNAFKESLELVEDLLAEPSIETTRLFQPVLHLQAQVLYRLERFRECLDGPYARLLSIMRSSGDVDMDLYSNTLAAHSSLAMIDPAAAYKVAEPAAVAGAEKSYEVLYNRACRAANLGSYAQAEQLLEKSKVACKESMTEAGYEEDEIASELAMIDSQLAYVWQQIGKDRRAVNQYKAVLACEGVDPAVAGVSANNLVAAYSIGFNLAEFEPIFKTAMSTESMAKYNSIQRKIVETNNVIFSKMTGNIKHATEQMNSLVKEYPNDDLVQLVRVTFEYRGKKSRQALQNEIKRLAGEYPHSMHIQSAYIDVLSKTSAWDKAIEHVQQLMSDPAFELYRLDLAAKLIGVYKKANKLDEAHAFLDNLTKNVTLDDRTTSLRIAELKTTLRMYKEAVTDLMRLVKEDPLDTRALSSLVDALKHTDPITAKKYAGQLAMQNRRSDNHDENDNKSLADELNDRKSLNASKNTGDAERAKKKRKRKKILPKDYDPNVQPDPERWIPKRFRKSTLASAGGHNRMKKRNKRQDGDAAGKGTQGINIEGGGIGGTGSARIAGLAKAPSTVAEPAPVAALTPAPAASTATNKKKKKGKK